MSHLFNVTLAPGVDHKQVQTDFGYKLTSAANAVAPRLPVDQQAG